MPKTPLIVTLFLFVLGIVSLLFISFPNLDLEVTKCFYPFLYKDSLAYKSYRFLLSLYVVSLVGFIFMSWAKNFFPKIGGKLLPKLKTKGMLFLTCALVLGPGVLSHQIKDIMKRPRPTQITHFGGDQEFMPLFQRNVTEKNTYKSFVSGDAAVGFYLMAIFLLIPGWRRRGLLVSLAVGLVLGVGRLCVGAHFPSDILFAGFINYALIYLLYVAFFYPKFETVLIRK